MPKMEIFQKKRCLAISKRGKRVQNNILVIHTNIELGSQNRRTIKVNKRKTNARDQIVFSQEIEHCCENNTGLKQGRS